MVPIFEYAERLAPKSGRIRRSRPKGRARIWIFFASPLDWMAGRLGQQSLHAARDLHRHVFFFPPANSHNFSGIPPNTSGASFVDMSELSSNLCDLGPTPPFPEPPRPSIPFWLEASGAHREGPMFHLSTPPQSMSPSLRGSRRSAPFARRL